MTPINPNCKLNQPKTTYLALGDWSNDGHGKHENHYYNVNYPISAIQQAYKNSCEALGIQFHDGDDFRNPENTDYVTDQIFTEYENDTLRPHEIKILKDAGLITEDFMKTYYLEETPDHRIIFGDTESVATLIMRFIAYSMPADFTYTKHTENPIEPINGDWCDLNIQFGYGIFD